MVDRRPIEVPDIIVLEEETVMDFDVEHARRQNPIFNRRLGFGGRIEWPEAIDSEAFARRVADYQQENELGVDGIMGANTWRVRGEELGIDTDAEQERWSRAQNYTQIWTISTDDFVDEGVQRVREFLDPICHDARVDQLTRESLSQFEMVFMGHGTGQSELTVQVIMIIESGDSSISVTYLEETNQDDEATSDEPESEGGDSEIDADAVAEAAEPDEHPSILGTIGDIVSIGGEVVPAILGVIGLGTASALVSTILAPVSIFLGVYSIGASHEFANKIAYCQAYTIAFIDLSEIGEARSVEEISSALGSTLADTVDDIRRGRSDAIDYVESVKNCQIENTDENRDAIQEMERRGQSLSRAQNCSNVWTELINHHFSGSALSRTRALSPCSRI